MPHHSSDSQESFESTGKPIILRGSPQNVVQPLFLVIAIAVACLALSGWTVRENISLAILCIAAIIGLCCVAYYLHQHTLYADGDRLTISHWPLRRGNTYTMTYTFQSHDRGVDLEQLNGVATIRCLQYGTHRFSKVVKRKNRGATRQSIANFRKSFQDILHEASVSAQSISLDNQKVSMTFTVQIPKWHPSSGNLGQYSTVSSTIQWIFDIEARKHKKQRRTRFLLQVAAPRVDS